MIAEIGVLVLTVVLAAVYYFVKANKRDKIDLHGKHCVITGGSSGIGWELCLDAFQQGAHVSIVARNMDRLNKIKAALEDMKKGNPSLKNQKVNIESVDISADFDKTKQAFDRV